MSEYVIFTSNYCDKETYLSEGESACNGELVLKIQPSELANLKLAESSISLELENADFANIAQIWSLAFFSVIFFYCVGLGVGSVLGFIKEAIK